MAVRTRNLARVAAIAGLLAAVTCWIGFVQQLQIEMATLSGDDGLRRPMIWWLIGGLVSTTVMIVSGAVVRLHRYLDAPPAGEAPEESLPS